MGLINLCWNSTIKVVLLRALGDGHSSICKVLTDLKCSQARITSLKRT
jgi:hypothetical protein